MGKKVPYDQTFLTPRAVYREGITVADADDPGPFEDSIPIIQLDIDTANLIQNADDDIEDRFGPAGRAYNAHLELFTIFEIGATVDCEPSFEGILNSVLIPSDARCHATIRVWIVAVPQIGDSTLGENWCLVHEQSVLTSTLITLRNIPAGVYKVTVTHINDDCTLHILEQHTN